MWGFTRKKDNATDSKQRIAELYKKWGPAIYSRCRRMLKDTSLAEDATQEIFVLVLKHIENAPDDKAALYWMYRISTNYCLNQIRNRARHAEPLEELPERASEHPDESAQNRDLAMRILTRMPESLRAAAMLHHVDGMNQDEVAKVLGISRRTVINHLQEFDRRAQKFVNRQEEVNVHDK